MRKELKEKLSMINNKNDLWKLITITSTTYEDSIDQNFKTYNGIYYTHRYLSKYIVNELFEKSLNDRINEVHKLKFLEPCVGMGIFVFSYLEKISELNLSKEKNKQIVENIYVSDIDQNVLEIFKLLFIKFIKIYFDIEMELFDLETRICNGLSFVELDNNITYVSIEEAFKSLIEGQKFDIIITNPPYKTLRVEKNKFDNKDDFEKYKNNFNQISSLAKKTFKFANQGVLNLFKLFIEEIIVNYSSSDAAIALLIPSSIQKDRSSTKLRTLLLDKNKLLSVSNINESNMFFNASQSLSIFILQKNKPTSDFYYREIVDLDNLDNGIYINYPRLKRITNSNMIIGLNNKSIKIFDEISKFERLSNLTFIKNMRGELDLTANKEFIMYDEKNNESDLKLIRGRNIDSFHLKDTHFLDSVSEKFLSNRAKIDFIKKERIASQQVSNINKVNRLIFSFIRPNYILGNSCNFISVEENIFEIDVYYLLGLMNSTIMNWFFKSISSNNHINNYEIDSFPIPLNNKNLILEISRLTKEVVHDNKMENTSIIDSLVYQLFNINKNDLHSFNTVEDKEMNNKDNLYNKTIIEKLKTDLLNFKNINLSNKNILDYILNNDLTFIEITKKLSLEKEEPFILEVIENIITKYKLIKNNKVLNHNLFKLSDLDMEMIKCVPQGGNWKNISDDIIQKSQRLIKISQTGGRTTLYGRIDYNEPSYTITTYFNRPGNGTYIHPVHDRVISVREAARLQSFDDNYFFIGNQRNLLNQVGNAVPPLMSFEIMKQIKKHINIENSIDLFSGAGGMSLGSKWAGIKTILAVDFDRSAAITFKVNNPETFVIHGDLTDSSTHNLINTKTNNINVDLVCGGPPCQGFSMAGNRFEDDPRNQLFKEYLTVLKNTKPKVFVFENVEGIMSMQKGEIYKEIMYSFSKLGYNVTGRKLLASDYGVPQKRKRVFIIGVRNDLNINPDLLYPDEKHQTVSAFSAIGDLEKIDCGNNSSFNPLAEKSNYIKYINNL